MKKDWLDKTTTLDEQRMVVHKHPYGSYDRKIFHFHNDVDLEDLAERLIDDLEHYKAIVQGIRKDIKACDKEVYGGDDLIAVLT